jgi:hypothetical protein
LQQFLSALIGPNVANFTKDIISDHLYTGSYISLAVLTIIPIFLLFFYRTDENPKPKENISGNQRSYFELLKNPIILQAIVTAAFAYSIMSFIMTATPISMYKDAWIYFRFDQYSYSIPHNWNVFTLINYRIIN